jgi:hypothetical protein
VTPDGVRAQLPDGWLRPDEETILSWASNGGPGVRRTTLSDEPGRVVVDLSG